MHFEQFAREVQAAADAGRGEGECGRLGLGERHQLTRVLRREAGMHRQHIGCLGEHGDGHQILVDVEREILHQGRIDGEVAGRNHQQRAAVGRGALDLVDTDIAGSARQVLDNHVGTGFFTQAIGEDARQHIDRAAGRKGRNDADFVGGCLRGSVATPPCAERECRSGSQ